ncbi:hypothetical protein KIN20_016910 [Parelaphostrongylus tenuis]|uniref:Uncharacterized protein n=1 Tax=Parelaphostrongylus tenuis TaxID=148309 RepID=A0AAD5QR38_PARTN|nr:hypothetical protein KIN20_016910 [Parelaphostrongylus tenuis]
MNRRIQQCMYQAVKVKENNNGKQLSGPRLKSIGGRPQTFARNHRSPMKTEIPPHAKALTGAALS